VVRKWSLSGLGVSLAFYGFMSEGWSRQLFVWFFLMIVMDRRFLERYPGSLSCPYCERDIRYNSRLMTAVISYAIP